MELLNDVIIQCEECGNIIVIKKEYLDAETSSYERQMGPEVEHYFDVEDWDCVECGKRFRVHGSIWEYPLGAYNWEDINVEALEENEDEF